jgi:membrane protein insertase Oxa1/YidC/SpoIIIJ
MPVFFGFISWGFPTGLVVYFATSNLFRIAQQSVILRLDRDKAVGGTTGGKGEAALPSKAVDPGSAEQPPVVEKSQPSPHASKKRKKRRRK